MGWLPNSHFENSDTTYHHESVIVLDKHWNACGNARVRNSNGHQKLIYMHHLKSILELSFCCTAFPSNELWFTVLLVQGSGEIVLSVSDSYHVAISYVEFQAV